jgi:hypothetical protein
VEPTSGLAPSELSVTVYRRDLATGVYSGTITITAASDAAKSPWLVPVQLTVGESWDLYLPIVLKSAHR